MTLKVGSSLRTFRLCSPEKIVRFSKPEMAKKSPFLIDREKERQSLPKNFAQKEQEKKEEQHPGAQKSGVPKNVTNNFTIVIFQQRLNLVKCSESP